MKPVQVFKKEDFESPVFSTPQERADHCNKLLSERLVKRFGHAGFFGEPNYQEPGDTHFILSTEMFPIPKESVKVELEGNYESINWKPCEKFQGKRVKVTVEEL